MLVYLAGENGKWRLLQQLNRGGGKMDIYFAGGITGNLFPVWKKIALGGGQQYEHLFGGGVFSARDTALV